jgi:hypothetical protein
VENSLDAFDSKIKEVKALWDHAKQERNHGKRIDYMSRVVPKLRSSGHANDEVHCTLENLQAPVEEEEAAAPANPATMYMECLTFYVQLRV